MLDLTRLRLLDEFARRGTIAETAVALGYSASAVSQQLATLEREAGAALLDRTARSARLTDAGRRLAAHAARILAAVEEAEADVSARAATPAGRVVVTAFPAAAVAFAPALTGHLAGYPDLSLVVRQGSAEGDLNELRSGEVDIVLGIDWRASPPDDGVTRVRLYRDALVLAVPPGHRLADPAEPLSDLRSETWISVPEPDPTGHVLDRLLGAGGRSAVRWEFEGLAMIVALVAHGAGVALVPHVALMADRHRVAVRELPPPPPAFDVYAVVRSAGLRNPAVAATVAALRRAASAVRAPRTRV
ncbi:LysR family transcriptional regulator [Virgisporangium ochraceum]|uniref:LysR family transcriptional regulator n=1 Tax=Virgisporangium ochraceum TaxID=65505 RepID=A0A8J4A543_9ACTN|nr:LysR family transcriptional regulator [Virgisporangium ochraceum]GIJ73550.1 LysR family transcriptional regulator [Virgisporangium ochraceum]